MRSSRRGSRDGEKGQVLALFAIFMTVLIAMGGLLFVGAHSMVNRRQLQNTADAAALAAANLLVQERGCSAAGNGGGPRGTITAAAQSMVTTNMAGAGVSVSVSCPTGYSNHAVRVDLSAPSPSFFQGTGFNVGASATAVNGQIMRIGYSVALLNPANSSWQNSRNGCSSFTVNGGITVTYEGSIMVNSTCLAGAGGAVKAINAAFRMSLTGGATMRIAGQYAPNTAGKITPEPEQNVRPLLPDPLAGLEPLCTSSVTSGCLAANVPARSVSAQCPDTSVPCILLPGTYNGIRAAGGSLPSTILLRPGVYRIQGKGLSIGSSGSILAIPAASLSSSDAVVRTRYALSLSSTDIGLNWQADCPPPPASSTCGVLIYNAPSGNSGWTTGGANSDVISVGAQGNLMLRAYQAGRDGTNGSLLGTYNNMVIWQQRTPLPTGANSGEQPPVNLGGGACVVLSGTTYVPGAQVAFGGGSCGAGGGGDEVATLQFIAFDLSLGGNNNFYFGYRADSFTAPTFYGLVE
ncbi:hypothetical protein BH23CHL7_BH23CHL7_06300 [soil metagenome]